MRHAIFLPIFGELADPRVVARLAADAEAAGFDGVYVWDHLRYREPVVEVADPWITLAAIAAATERVRLGPMVTPLARRRPQKVARETVTLDVLSGGRLDLGVGLGGDRGGELSAFGEAMVPSVRAAVLDEALEVLSALWSGEVVHHQGEHFLADGVSMRPRPVQQPRIPVWVAAVWPHVAPLRRAARWDGVFPIQMPGPDALSEVLSMVDEHRSAGNRDGHDVVVMGPADADPRPWEQAGATWWLTQFDAFTVTAAEVAAVIADGPKR